MSICEICINASICGMASNLAGEFCDDLVTAEDDDLAGDFLSIDGEDWDD